MHRQDGNQEEPFALPPPHVPLVPSQPSPARQSQHDVHRNEMETAIGKSSTGNDKDGIAVRSVLEMGYAKSTIDSAVEHLRKQGMYPEICVIFITSFKGAQNIKVLDVLVQNSISFACSLFLNVGVIY